MRRKIVRCRGMCWAEAGADGSQILEAVLCLPEEVETILYQKEENVKIALFP